MKRAPRCTARPWAACVVPLLVLVAGEARAALMVFQDGSQMEVLRYELAGDVVVLTAPNGKLLSVPRGSVDLDATRASNQKLDSGADPAGEALRLLDLRRVTLRTAELLGARLQNLARTKTKV